MEREIRGLCLTEELEKVLSVVLRQPKAAVLEDIADNLRAARGDTEIYVQ